MSDSLIHSPDPAPAGRPDGNTEAQERDGTRFPSFTQEMPVDVMANYSTVILSGRLESVSQNALSVERIPGERIFPVREAGAPVLVRGYDSQMEPFTLRGIITKSSMTRCVVSHLEIIRHDNMRKSVRYPLSPPTTAYTLEDPPSDALQECRLMNISTGGACIASSFPYSKGQALELRVELIPNAGHTSYHCQVVRVSGVPEGGFEYGLLFDQLDKNQLNALLRDIETIQAEAKRRITG